MPPQFTSLETGIQSTANQPKYDIFLLKYIQRRQQRHGYTQAREREKLKGLLVNSYLYITGQDYDCVCFCECVPVLFMNKNRLS